jgi:hypothetical protein
MAMSDRDLRRRVRELGDALKRAAQWQGSSIAVDGNKDDFVYESLCYLSVGVAATSHFTLTLVLRPNPKSGQPIPLFPKKPGYKKNFSFLVLKGSDGQIAFELCPGIFVKDRHGKRRAPDINLLCASSEEQPGHADLRAIWDAKYVYDETKRLADTAVSDFVVTFEELGSPNAPAAWIAHMPIQAFRDSGLITNGCPSTEVPAMLALRKIRETSGFPKMPVTRPELTDPTAAVVVGR